MKEIEQLLELKKNPYYEFSPEESKRLNDFLAKNSDTRAPRKKNGKDSEKNIPATVLNKNRVQKETGVIPVINHVVKIQKAVVDEASEDIDTETEAFEEIVHPDAVK